MKLNRIWGYGQLFGFSALDGKNSYSDDLVATLMHKSFEFRFETEPPMTLSFPLPSSQPIDALMSDFIEAGDLFMTFCDKDTLVGRSPVSPVLHFASHSVVKKGRELITGTAEGQDPAACSPEALAYTDCLYNENNIFFVCYRKPFFVIAYAHTEAEAAEKLARGLAADLDALRRARYDYYESLPPCRDERYEALYYKALSINKVNMRSAEGSIPCMWTTPDRVPHRHMWLWDSVFHAMALLTYNESAAKDAIRAVLAKEEDSGFIPHMMKPIPHDDPETQPQVLCWGVLKIYEKTGDLEYVRETAPLLEKYMSWVLENRDRNKNGLLEWRTDPTNPRCRCGESGQDNSPRFDFDEPMDAVDFSAFFANDANALSQLFDLLNDRERAALWRSRYLSIRMLMNEKMWCPDEGTYFDLLFDGRLTRVLTPNSFLPLFAGIPTAEQAEEMVQVLTDPERLWTAFPLATISATHPEFSDDMWRGGVWININYMIISGLRRYGFTALSEELRRITLETIDRWYQKTGVIFEFYDPADEKLPWLCHRKGVCPDPPDWRVHMHSITDFNWSACFTLLLIQNIIL